MLCTQSNIKKIALAASWSWALPLIDQLASRFKHPAGHPLGFPCVFAQKAFSWGSIKFILVPYDQTIQAHDYETLKCDLGAYLQQAADWDGRFSTASPLLVLFEPVNSIASTLGCEKIFIESLQYLIDHDEEDWSGTIPSDPEKQFWTMCFNGVQLFVNVSHPNNIRRKSRNLCDTLVLVINPRERFDVFAGSSREGYMIRSRIRDNVDIYDNLPRSPLLGHYQDGDLEWPQYMLPDDNTSPALACPLRFRNKSNDKPQVDDDLTKIAVANP